MAPPRALEAGLAALFTVAVCLASFLLQEPIRRKDGRGWDGVSYYKAAESVAAGGAPRTDSPYVDRPAVPWLVGTLFPGDLMGGFRWVNLAGALLGCALFYAWLRRWLADWRVRLAVYALFVLGVRSSIRLLWFYPVTNAQWELAAMLALLLAAVHPRPPPRPWPWLVATAALTALAVPVRGVIVAVVPLAATLADNPLSLRLPWFVALRPLARGVVRQLPALAAALVAALLVSSWVQRTGAQHRFGFEALRWLEAKEPTQLFLATLITFGPVVVLGLLEVRRLSAWLAEHQPLLAYLAGVVVLAIIGGSDTERILFWAAPVVLVMVGLAIERNLPTLRSLPLLAALVVTQALSQRWLATYPQTEKPRGYAMPLLAPYAERTDFLDLWSYHGRETVARTSTVQYALVVLLLWVWLRWRRSRLADTQDR